ncbi:MAG: ABC transporter permease [Chitinophagaceae bacterium]
MIKNYIRVALRNLWKNKAFTAINITGLATGLAICLLIVLYVKDELSYDRYNVNAERIYRIDGDINFNNTQLIIASTPEPLGAALKRDYPQVEEVVSFTQPRDIQVKKGDQFIQEHNSVFVDSTFFKVFTVPLINGNPTTALNEPNSVVINETTARKYFNSTDVVGQTLTINNSKSLKITGVIKDIPAQSHFHFNFLRPIKDSYRGNADKWFNNNNYNYVLLKPGVTKDFLQKAVTATVNKYLGKQLEEELHSSLTDMEKAGNYFHYSPIALTDIHLKSAKGYEWEANSSMSYVYVFSVIAIFILLIACVNFMNLSTARSANRAKEVGIRKVAGSLRFQLITQFLTESVLLSFFSLLLAIGLALLLLPLLNQVSGKLMHASTLFSTWLLPCLLVLVLVVGCIAGSYPAFYLSAFEPIQVLKGKVATGFKSSRLRSSLVVFQFSISIILIIGTIVIYNQLHYIQSRQIGYNREQVLVLHNTSPLQQHADAFREELTKIAGVENATISGSLPTAEGLDQNGWFRDANMDASKVIILTNFYIDEHYIPTLGMQMTAGRSFSKDFASDSSGILLNEAAVKLLGFKEPLNQVIYRSGDKNEPIPYHVVGVVKDFNFTSMHNKVGPLIMQRERDNGSIAIRIQANSNIPNLVSQVENKWNNAVPGQPFNYTFMDADFDKIYHAEQRMGKLFISFAVFAVLIACLGLLGLATYAAEQRTKEIGIRKVLGAGVGGIVTMLSKDFAKLVLIASLIAFPVAWWVMNKWLEDFAYRISISVWVFIAAGAIAVAIALLTVSFQALKAAFANPVKALRSE